MPSPVTNRRLLYVPNPGGLPFTDFPQDSFEDYAVGQETRGQSLNKGKNGNVGFTIVWTSNWDIQFNYLGAQAGDDMEAYTDSAALDGLNSDVGWSGAYVDRIVYTGIKSTDDAESYTNGAALNGLNGGTGWTAAWANHNN